MGKVAQRAPQGPKEQAAMFRPALIRFESADSIRELATIRVLRKGAFRLPQSDGFSLFFQQFFGDMCTKKKKKICARKIIFDHFWLFSVFEPLSTIFRRHVQER